MQGLKDRQALAFDYDLGVTTVATRADDLRIALIVAEVVECTAVSGDDFGLDVKAALRAGSGQFGRGIAVGNRRQVALVQMVLPSLVELVQALAGRNRKNFAKGLAAPPIGKELFEYIGSVPRRHKVADRLAFLV